MRDDDIVPFHTYLWKIASRCNIDCSYCYVYNSSDSRWRRQPKFMSEETARRSAERIREHLLAHGKRDAVIDFHGGEPLLGGVRHLDMLTRVIADCFAGSGIAVSVGVQSNGLLFDESIGDLMLERGMSIGVSLDGPPRVNDLCRLDHRGRPTSGELERRLSLLTSERYRPVFSGFLCVINPFVDAREVTEYLLSWQPPGIDFLLPLDNHERPPPGKVGRPDGAPYGEWLIEAFDYWSTLQTRSTIRMFRSIVSMLCGGETFVESLGLLPVDLVVIETNGEIEAVDSLKATYDGATALGFDVRRNDFDTVAADLRVRSRQQGLDELCQTCRRCSLVDVCGGGYVPHRYSEARGYDNPSVYCADLKRLIGHVADRVLEDVEDMNRELVAS